VKLLSGRFCCKCGKSEKEESIVEGFCLSCYKDEFPLIKSFPEKQLHITTCKLCGDLMYHGSWKDVANDSTQIIHKLIEEFVRKTKKIKGTEMVLVSEIEEPPFDVASKQQVKIVFEGTPNEEVPPYQQEVELEIVINVGACDRCSKFARGYFESIIQVRSDRRNIREDEQMFISKLIEQKREEKIEGNRMAYISKAVDQSKGGIDLYIGSESFAKTLANFLAENLAASIEYSTKLKSMKDGKPIYQSTYCVRVPYFEIGDVVSYQNTPWQITGINFGRVEMLNLKTHEMKTLSLKESHPDYLKVLKKKDQLQKFIIMAIQSPNISVMNSVSYETIDIDIKSFFDKHQEGDEILMVELPEGTFECKELDALE
jgi:nonsense-mediated mRNA decay protein 3